MILASFAPLLSAVTAAPLEGSISLALLLLCGTSLSYVREWRKASQFLSALDVSLTAPQRVSSGEPFSTTLNIASHPDSDTWQLSLRFEPVLALYPENDIEEFSFDSAHAHTTRTLVFSAWARADISWKTIYIRCCRPGGLFLFQASMQASTPCMTTVYPRHLGGRAVRHRQTRSTVNGIAYFDSAGGEGKEFDRLRSYSAGDDLRRVDWKRTARRGSLVVRVFRPESHQRICIAVDCGRRSSTRVQKKSQLDYALDAAAQLTSVAIALEDEVGLFAFDHRQLASFMPSRGRHQLERILDGIRPLTPSRFDAQYELVRTWSHKVQRRSLIVLLTTFSTLPGLEEIQRALSGIQRKHYPLVVGIRDPQHQQLMYSGAATLQSAFIQAAAVDEELGIERKLSGMRARGIDWIYADASDIGPKLEKRYHELKRHGAI